MTMASGLYGNFITESLNNTLTYALNASDTISLDLVTDTYTPNFDTHDEIADVTNIVTGTGWAGAVTLASPTFAHASGFATFDGTDVSAGSTTLSNIEGVIVWDNTPVGDPLLAAVDFGATYNTVSGTFAITWNASGIWRIDYIP